MIAKRGGTVTVTVWAAAALAGALVAGGCGGKQQATMEPTVEQADGATDAAAGDDRGERLAQSVQEFAAARKGLQGHADATSRGQLADALGKLSETLKLLRGPRQDGAFRQQVSIIDRARTQLTG